MRTVRTISLACVVLLAVACGEELPSTPSTTNQPKATANMLAAKAAWPPSDKNSNPPLAPNILTKNHYLVLDASDSMNSRACQGGGTKIDVAKAAVTEFISQVPDQDNVGFLVFNWDGVLERVPLGSGRAHKDAMTKVVRDIKASNGTPLHDAVTKGYKKLIEQGRRQLGYGEYNLVVITDGEANPGQDPGSAVDHITNYSPVQIRTIGFCIGKDHSLNRAGRTVYTEANDLQGLRRGLAAVLAEAPTFDLTAFKQ